MVMGYFDEFVRKHCNSSPYFGRQNAPLGVLGHFSSCGLLAQGNDDHDDNDDNDDDDDDNNNNNNNTLTLASGEINGKTRPFLAREREGGQESLHPGVGDGVVREVKFPKAKEAFGIHLTRAISRLYHAERREAWPIFQN